MKNYLMVKENWKIAIDNGFGSYMKDIEKDWKPIPIEKELNKNIEKLKSYVKNKLPIELNNFYKKIENEMEKTGANIDLINEILEDTLGSNIEMTLIEIAMDICPKQLIIENH